MHAEARQPHRPQRRALPALAGSPVRQWTAVLWRSATGDEARPAMVVTR